MEPMQKKNYVRKVVDTRDLATSVLSAHGFLNHDCRDHATQRLP